MRAKVPGIEPRLCPVIQEAETARLHSGRKRRFSCLEDSLAVPLSNCQTQPSRNARDLAYMKTDPFQVPI